jgi:DEAD/DEAH box helicase domain-containing protein
MGTRDNRVRRRFLVVKRVHEQGSPPCRFWIDVPSPTLELLRCKNFKPAAAIHSAAHAVLNRFVFPDIKTECKAPEKENKLKESKRKRPGRCVQCPFLSPVVQGLRCRLIFYDSIGLGGGVSTKAFDNSKRLVLYLLLR